MLRKTQFQKHKMLHTMYVMLQHQRLNIIVHKFFNCFLCNEFSIYVVEDNDLHLKIIPTVILINYNLI